MPTDPSARPYGAAVPNSLAAAVIAVADASDLDAALASVLAAAGATTGSTRGAIVLRDPDRAALAVAATSGMDEAAAAHLPEAIRAPGDPFGVAVASGAATFGQAGAADDGSAYVMAYLPLTVSSGGVEDVAGVLGLGWPAPHEVDDDDRSTLTALAALAALAVDRARATSAAAERSEWFERMAHSDPLTGLANERTVGRILELELARAGRHGGEVSFAMFDVDAFRATNLEDGHAAGDDVLRRVAAVLAESVRLVDTVGRVGGDEFVLIAPGSAGMTVAERVLAGVRALPPVAGRPVSVSAGVARFPEDGADAQSLIDAATRALSRAKSSGGARAEAIEVGREA